MWESLTPNHKFCSQWHSWRGAKHYSHCSMKEAPVPFGAILGIHLFRSHHQEWLWRGRGETTFMMWWGFLQKLCIPTIYATVCSGIWVFLLDIGYLLAMGFHSISLFSNLFFEIQCINFKYFFKKNKGLLFIESCYLSARKSGFISKVTVLCVLCDDRLGAKQNNICYIP